MPADLPAEKVPVLYTCPFYGMTIRYDFDTNTVCICPSNGITNVLEKGGEVRIEMHREFNPAYKPKSTRRNFVDDYS